MAEPSGKTPPSRLGRLLTQPLSLPPFLKRWPLWIATSVLVTASVAGVCGWSTALVASDIHRELKEAADDCRAVLREEQEVHRARVSRLAASPFFSRPLAGKDAGPWLSGRVPWDPAMPRDMSELRGRLKTGLEPDPTSGLSLPRAVSDRLRKTGWMQAEAASADLMSMDTNWFSGFDGFGFWELSTDIPLSSRDGFPAPEVNYSQLETWAKVRLLQGLAGGDARAAAREVRSLAWLLLTTESLVAAYMGIAMLALEERFYDRSLELHLPVDGWAPIPKSLRDDAKAAIAYTLAAEDEDLSTAVLAASAEEGLPPLIRCTAVNQWAIDSGLRSWVEDEDAKLSFREKPGCRLKWARHELEELYKDRANAPPRIRRVEPDPAWSVVLGRRLVEQLLPELARLDVSRIQNAPWCSRAGLHRRMASSP